MVIQDKKSLYPIKCARHVSGITIIRYDHSQKIRKQNQLSLSLEACKLKGLLNMKAKNQLRLLISKAAEPML